MNHTDLTNGMLSALTNVRFAMGNPRRQAKEETEYYVRMQWEKGNLPLEIREGVWLVGWRVNKTFFSSWVKPITVGPAKPSKVRERHYNDVFVQVGRL
jgi:hypothetical protein